MRGVAYDPVFRAKLMALHQQGVPFTMLSADFDVSREVLGRWWKRYQAQDLAGLHPRSRRPHRSPSQLGRATETHILQLRARRLSAWRWTSAGELCSLSVKRRGLRVFRSKSSARDKRSAS